MQAAVAGLDGGQRSRFRWGWAGLEAEGYELIHDLFAGVEGRDPSDGREGQRHPGAVDPVAQLDAVIAVAERHGEIPLSAVAIDGNFLQGVGMGDTVLHAGDIRQAQA